MRALEWYVAPDAGAAGLAALALGGISSVEGEAMQQLSRVELAGGSPPVDDGVTKDGG
ncbi:hypothetical protein GCM10028775_76680 [Catellatospora paridis]